MKVEFVPTAVGVQRNTVPSAIPVVAKVNVTEFVTPEVDSCTVVASEVIVAVQGESLTITVLEVANNVLLP